MWFQHSAWCLIRHVRGEERVVTQIWQIYSFRNGLTILAQRSSDVSAESLDHKYNPLIISPPPHPSIKSQHGTLWVASCVCVCVCVWASHPRISITHRRALTCLPWANPLGRMEQRGRRAAVTHEGGAETGAACLFITLKINFLGFPARQTFITAPAVMSRFARRSCCSSGGGGEGQSKSSALPPAGAFWILNPVCDRRFFCFCFCFFSPRLNTGVVAPWPLRPEGRWI